MVSGALAASSATANGGTWRRNCSVDREALCPELSRLQAFLFRQDHPQRRTYDETDTSQLSFVRWELWVSGGVWILLFRWVARHSTTRSPCGQWATGLFIFTTTELGDDLLFGAP
jgi:hypothetical protein